MSKRRHEGIEQYNHPPGGWDVLKAVGALKDQQATVTGMKALARQNQPDGFDRPGCAWPDPKHTSAFEFCENGAKAVTWGGDDKARGPGVL
jgi:hypothetical protein